MKFPIVFLPLFTLFSFASDWEETAASRLKRFYADPKNPSPMNESSPKVNAITGEPLRLNPHLRLPTPLKSTDFLLNASQLKGTKSFQEKQCERVLDIKFPKLKCKDTVQGKATAEPNDQVEMLAATWVESVDKDLDRIPTQGESSLPLWSDDYWRIQWGVTSYRYSQGQAWNQYKEAVDAYSQPKEWEGLSGRLGVRELAKAVALWSPAEKYDLSVGDQKFTLTNEQKEEGLNVLGQDGNVEPWMGICHGWAAAAIRVPRPKKAFTVVGLGGLKVQWYPHDVRALASLAWANGEAENNFVGGRCDVKKTKTFKNGRLAQQECFDTNAATFHLALGNMVGKAKASFVMDKTFDYEVWNQPIHSYEFTYFNPLDPSRRSKKWRDVAVRYDEKFKSTDRFQDPMTRGTYNRATKSYKDKGIKMIVGVMAKVVYLAEVSPSHGKAPSQDQLVQEIYTYDLELHESRGALVALGGEWHNNVHPDFLWVPRNDAVARLDVDRFSSGYTASKEPEARVTKLAQVASDAGYPLCDVIEALIEKSTTARSHYKCRVW